MELCRRSKKYIPTNQSSFPQKNCHILEGWCYEGEKKVDIFRSSWVGSCRSVDGHAWYSLCPRHHTLNLPRKQRPKQGKTQENPQLGLVVHGHPHIAKSQHKGKNKIQTENCKTLVFIKWIKIDVEINERVQTTYVFSPRIIWLLYPSA